MRRFSRESIVTLAVIGIVIFVGLSYLVFVQFENKREQAANTPASKALRVAADETPYTDLTGNILSLDTYLGRIIIVNSWASWSPDSSKELQLLAAFGEQYNDEDLVVLAINRAEPKTTAERFLQTLGVTDRVELILDADDRYYQSVEGFAMPETIVYNQEGEIVYRERGPITSEQLAAVVNELMK